MFNSRSGRHQFSLAVTLFLLSTILVLAILWKVYQPKPESTVPAEYHYRLDDLDSSANENGKTPGIESSALAQ